MIIPSIHTLVGSLPEALGSYAPTVREIEVALQSPQCSLSSVAAAIEKDPDFTARLLRLANSGFYGFPHRVSTVTEALSLIGILQVHGLVVSTSIVERFAGVGADIVNMGLFWRHSLACGIAARDLALMLKMRDPDKYFVAGLLHDVGRLALLSCAPKLTQMILDRTQRSGEPLLVAEKEILGYDHADIGGVLMKHWGFPPRLVDAVADHHRPLGSLRSKENAAVVHFADHLVHAMKLGTSGEVRIPRLVPGAWELLNLGLESIEVLVHGIDSQIEAVEGAFFLRPQGGGSHARVH